MLTRRRCAGHHRPKMISPRAPSRRDKVEAVRLSLGPSRGERVGARGCSRWSRRFVMAKKPAAVRRKLVEFDAQTWQALDLLARDSMKTFQELADEALHDLLRKYDRPTDL